MSSRGSALDPRRSIVARLTLALALIAVAVFSAAGASLYWTLERELRRVEFDEVQRKVEQVQQLVANRPNGIDDAARQELDSVLSGHGNLLVSIRAADGRRLFSNTPDPLLTIDSATPSMVELEDGRSTAGCRVSLTDAGAAQGAQVTVALAHSMRGEVLRMYGATVAWICGLGIVATAALAAWATRRGFRPVRRLAEQAARITPESLSLRLAGEDGDDELHGLAASFNQALDRLQQAYARLEAFNADVAHELRTPLATLIGGTEVTLASPRPPEELLALHEANLEVLHRLRSIVNDMLFLARADTGEQAADRQSVSLAAEAGKVVDYYEAALQERGLRVALRGDAQLACNVGLLRRALSNLLSNAVKHARGSDRIDIEIDDGARLATVRVRNHGDTIAPEALPRIFDRFYRAESSRSARSDSHGLGLAIVRAIAGMHGGAVEARSAGGVTEVGFRLAK